MNKYYAIMDYPLLITHYEVGHKYKNWKLITTGCIGIYLYEVSILKNQLTLYEETLYTIDAIINMYFSRNRLNTDFFGKCQQYLHIIKRDNKIKNLLNG